LCAKHPQRVIEILQELLSFDVVRYASYRSTYMEFGNNELLKSALDAITVQISIWAALNGNDVGQEDAEQLVLMLQKAGIQLQWRPVERVQRLSSVVRGLNVYWTEKSVELFWTFPNYLQVEPTMVSCTRSRTSSEEVCQVPSLLETMAKDLSIYLYWRASRKAQFSE
jgi:hypothetical protein